MSRKEIIMPALGMAQTSGIIVEWFRQVGEIIKKDEPIISIETDKTTMDIPSSHEGVVVEIIGEIGVEIAVGTVIGWIGTETDAENIEKVKPSAKKPPPEKKEESAVTPKPSVKEEQKPVQNKGTENHILISPKARRIAEEKGISLSSLLRNRQLIQPFDSDDIGSHIIWMQNQGSAGASSLTRFKGRICAAQFFEMSEILKSEHSEEFDKAQLWAGINATILHRHNLLREHLGLPNSPQAKAFDIREGRWKESYIKDFVGLRPGKYQDKPTESPPVQIIYIEHSHVLSVLLPSDFLLGITLTLNSRDKTGEVLVASSVSLKNPSLLFLYFEDLVSAFENPLNLLL